MTNRDLWTVVHIRRSSISLEHSDICATGMCRSLPLGAAATSGSPAGAW